MVDVRPTFTLGYSRNECNFSNVHEIMNTLAK